MVGLVLVSHSAKLAEGVAELAAQMAGPEVRISAAGGLDEPGALGTDASRVLEAIGEVWSGDGVLVLLDLGSAVLSAELAVDLLEDDRRAKVLLTAAPLVEGAVAAAVSAGLGDPLEAVAAAARRGLEAKEAQLGPQDARAAGAGASPSEQGAGGGEEVEPALSAQAVVRNRLGLHARPAALLVRTLAGFDADVTLRAPASGRGPADARSLTAVGALGVRCGDVLEARARGPEAAAALDALRRLSGQGFGEPDDLVAPADAADQGTGRPVDQAPASDRAPGQKPPPAGVALAGTPASPGVASGPALALRRAPVAKAVDLPASDPTAEWAALEAALTQAARDIRRSRDAVAGRTTDAAGAIFDAHLLLLDDPALRDAARADILGGHRSAASAWDAAVSRAADAWGALEDPYQRARAADVREVGDQVLRRLGEAAPGAPAASSPAAGRPAPGLPADAPAEQVAPPARWIVVVDELTPADVAGLDPAVVAGIAASRGGPSSHAVILTRALGVPAVVGCDDAILDVADDTMLLVDGDAGTVTVDPPAEVTAAAARRRRARVRGLAAAAELAAGPAVTRDGIGVAVEANVSLPAEARTAVDAGADGVGLLRSEFLFLGAAHMPDEDEQAAAYDAVAAALGGRPLTIRTLDAGADKPLAFLRQPPERNPFLGVRGLRLSLLHPDLLRVQLRAVLRVAAAHPGVRLLLPMVTEADELRRAREALDKARAELDAEGAPTPEGLQVGVMLEVPSAALLAGHLAPLADFFSVGTNDLTQYTLAAERGNAGVAALGDPLHPAVLRLVAGAVEAAAAAGRTVAVCGEAAGDPAAVPLLLGLGVRELSMGAASIAAAKQAVRSTDLAAARSLAAEALAAGSAAAVRRLLAAAADSR